ncbi:thioredoxin reductase (NADPH) [Streptomyces sp. WMMB 714]|uniref:NAD(P)/FAD-dependent oxidoreductase n=1 Tax=Streptomyces sp. WMMB 714 TaxID=1286822 RepID=UPI000823F58E|nr:NAD(P)/FAD-dependent oxidoreductase [Streptomyces sp. WMMB 714]SCK34089.1 thioredoxin reductase (NADPH) [Streptomyces sp. WMMB 714]
MNDNSGAAGSGSGGGPGGASGGPGGSASYDVVVVGGGAGGLSAALVLARSRRPVAVVDSGSPRNAPSAHVHGFLSRDGQAPSDLVGAGRAEVAGYGGELIDGRVRSIEPGFTVRLDDGRALRARRVVVATGLRDELPAIPGVRERWGQDVLHCPYCHGYEVRDQPIGVLGSGPGAVHQALLLGQWSRDVVLFRHRLPLSAEEAEQLTARDVHIADGEVERLVTAGDRLEGVALAGGRVVPRRAVFVPPRMVPADGLLTDLGCERDGSGWVATDGSGLTGVAGVWAVGNVADPMAAVVNAAAGGASAAIAVNRSLVEEEVARAVADHRAGGRTRDPGARAAAAS